MAKLTRERLEEIRKALNTQTSWAAVVSDAVCDLVAHAAATVDQPDRLPKIVVVPNESIPSRAEIAMRLHAGLMANSFLFEQSVRDYKTSSKPGLVIAEKTALTAVIHTDALLVELKKGQK